MTEAEIVELIRSLASEPHPGVHIGIGDDAALFHFTGGDVLLSVDSVFEHVHFDLEMYGLSDVGWKAAAAGLSDIAAMGGQPTCALMSLAFDEAPDEARVRTLVCGVLEMLSSCHCALIGGDVCRSKAGLAIGFTVAGIPPPTGAVRRGGARDGDFIGLTGTLGDSAAGLHILASGREDLRERFTFLAEAHLRPWPRVREGGLLAAAGVTAMEDVSDGLAADLSHICVESGLGCEVEEMLIPVSNDAIELASEVGADIIEWSLSGGEDYELIFTAGSLEFDRAAESLASHGCDVAMLGTMNAGPGCILKRRDGTAIDLRAGGFDHFREG